MVVMMSGGITDKLTFAHTVLIIISKLYILYIVYYLSYYTCNLLLVVPGKQRKVSQS